MSSPRLAAFPPANGRAARSSRSSATTSWPLRAPCIRLRDLPCRAAEPVLETRLPESRVLARHEGALGQQRAGVTRIRVSANLARIVACAQVPSDELVETELLGSRHLKCAIQRRSNRDACHRTGDIFRRYGLDEHRCQAHGVAIGRHVGDALDELKKLRRAD